MLPEVVLVNIYMHNMTATYIVQVLYLVWKAFSSNQRACLIVARAPSRSFTSTVKSNNYILVSFINNLGILCWSHIQELHVGMAACVSSQAEENLPYLTRQATWNLSAT